MKSTLPGIRLRTENAREVTEAFFIHEYSKLYKSQICIVRILEECVNKFFA